MPSAQAALKTNLHKFLNDHWSPIKFSIFIRIYAAFHGESHIVYRFSISYAVWDDIHTQLYE